MGWLLGTLWMFLSIIGLIHTLRSQHYHNHACAIERDWITRCDWRAAWTDLDGSLCRNRTGAYSVADWRWTHRLQYLSTTLSCSTMSFNAGEKKAWVTLLTKASYLPGTLVLEHSLRSVQSKYPLVCMVTPSLPEDVRRILQRQNIRVREIQPLYPERRRDLEDKRFRDTWTKLR